MKWISLLLFFLLSAALPLYADSPTSFRQPHPLAWQHQLPTGEMPGWSRNWWINFEIGNANVWNAPLWMSDKRTGKRYDYTADFEQATSILEVGKALSEKFAAAIEVPYAYRGGGALDGFIDGFHVFIQNRRYNRQYYPKYQTIHSVKTDNVEYYTGDPEINENSNLKLKLKWWPIKWGSKGKCPCGIGFSSQTKFPTVSEKSPGSTGDIDQSLLINMAFPLFSASRLALTGGHTFLGDNPAMKDWPRYNYITMYEANLDLEISQGLGLLLLVRGESPFLKVKHLQYEDLSSDPNVIYRNRGASGWNSLVRWRGTNALGFRYRASGGNQIQFLMAEDWGLGPYDAKDDIYSNGAPDVNFILQTQFIF